MRSLDSYVPPGALAGEPTGELSILARAAAALRNPELADDLLSLLRIPRLLRAFVNPYVRRALYIAADLIDPTKPNP